LRGKAGGRSQSLDDISPSLRVAASSPLAIHRHLSGAVKPDETLRPTLQGRRANLRLGEGRQEAAHRVSMNFTEPPCRCFQSVGDSPPSEWGAAKPCQHWKEQLEA